MDSTNSSAPLPVFDMPRVMVNSSGWGPSPTNNEVAEQFDGMPFQQFSKCDRIGRIVDWVGGDRLYKKGDTRDRYTERLYGSSATAGAQYDYVHETEENFQLVDSSKPQKPPMRQFRRGGFPYRKVTQKDQERREQEKYGQSQKMKRSIEKEKMRAFKAWQRRGGIRGGRGGPGRRFGDRQQGKGRQPSIQVQAEWVILEELDFQRLSKLSLPNVEPGQDIPGESYGTLHYYDRAQIDKVTVKNPLPLQKVGGAYYNVTTTEDPVIAKLATSSAGNVFATDIILATLMTASRSANSWDIVVTRLGNKLFFDKRNVGSSKNQNPVDMLTVSETAGEPPNFETVGINNPRDLAMEALYINQNFRRQVLKRGEKPFTFEHDAVPFEEDREDKLEVGYRYRTWSLGALPDGTPIKLVARTETDAVALNTTGNGPPTQKLTIKAFNEWDSSAAGGVDWRSKLDVQKGAVLAAEMKNNSCKVAKWTLQAILAGSDYIKYGYVSRNSVKNSAEHVILGTQQFRPADFAANINLNLDNCWGVLYVLIKFFMTQPVGKYLMLKDPIKPVVRIYTLPEGTFESSEEEDEDESEESSGGEGELD